MPEYTDNFYQSRAAGSLSSAEQIAPLVCELVRPRSVIDVGCGTGEWLWVFQQHGAVEIKGIDGPWVDEAKLRIRPEDFICWDLSTPYEHTGERYDLAISLEVAEHLPVKRAADFVGMLTQVAPVVLFSAAVPQQGGTGHLNEQWQSYWVEKFSKFGYLAIDCLRAKIWNSPEVKFWYAQNTLLFVERGILAAMPALKAEYERGSCGPLSIVHPELFLSHAEGSKAMVPGLVGTIKSLPRLLRKSLQHRSGHST